LPDSVGLGSSAPPPPAAADADDDPAGAAASGTAAFSGAAPEDVASWNAAGGGTAWPVGVPYEGQPAGPLDEQEERACRSSIAEAVRALLAGDPGAAETALALVDASTERQARAVTLAGRVVAARVPALSGVSGEVVFDEDESDLRRAYAELLAERVEQSRARLTPTVTRDHLLHVARVCSAAAPATEGAESDPSWPAAALPGPPEQDLRALCLLLAQTSRDGAPGPEALVSELQDVGH
jgi:hypothetical protein